MILVLLILAAAPIFILLFYFYFRDKYEKEPIGKLFWALFLGMIITIPIIFIEYGLDDIWKPIEPAINNKFATAFYSSFIVASLTEEAFKFLAFFLIIWRSKNFNEKFDGIVYAVFISLGFALVENVLYVTGEGVGVGVLRALTAVPGHALFGVAMGYYLGQAKFSETRKSVLLMYAFLVPFVLHGLYDFIIFSENTLLLLLFIPYIIYMWIRGLKNMKTLSDNSVFKTGYPVAQKLENTENNTISENTETENNNEPKQF